MELDHFSVMSPNNSFGECFHKGRLYLLSVLFFQVHLLRNLFLKLDSPSFGNETKGCSGEVRIKRDEMV